MGRHNFSNATTANFMSKLSIGKAEDLATTVLLAMTKIFFSPSYECQNVVVKYPVKSKILQDFVIYL